MVQLNSLATQLSTDVASKKGRDDQIMKYAPLVKSIVDRIAIKLPSHIDKEDLINVGVIGLMSALERFDESRNIRFETFARFRIRGAILDELRARDNVSRSARNKDAKLERAYAVLRAELGRMPTEEEVSGYLGITLEQYYKLLDDAKGVCVLSSEDLPPDYFEKYAQGDVLERIEQENPFALITRHEIKSVLKNAIESLPEKEKLVLSLYYYEELTLKEIGAILELTESRICQIHSQAVLKLRGVLRAFKEKEDFEFY